VFGAPGPFEGSMTTRNLRFGFAARLVNRVLQAPGLW
jgi:hypothetical protein